MPIFKLLINKKIFLILIFINIGFIRTDSIKIVNEKTLSERFIQAGYKDFIEKTKILTWLADCEFNNLWHIITIIKHFFFEFNQLDSIMKKLELRDSLNIYKIILKEFPYVYKEIIKMRFLSTAHPLFISFQDENLLRNRFEKAQLNFFIEKTNLIKLLTNEEIINIIKIPEKINTAFQQYFNWFNQTDLYSIRATTRFCELRFRILKCILTDFPDLFEILIELNEEKIRLL